MKELSIMNTEIRRQILIEINEIIERIEESLEQAKPMFIIKMYREFLQQKQDELNCLSN